MKNAKLYINFSTDLLNIHGRMIRKDLKKFVHNFVFHLRMRTFMSYDEGCRQSKASVVYTDSIGTLTSGICCC